MTRNVELPPEPYHTHLCNIPIEIIPLALGALESRANSFVFPPEHYHNGVQLIRHMQVMILLGTDEIVESIERLYRLLDTTFNGAVYSAEETPDGVTITPAIPDVPAVPPLPMLPATVQLNQRLDNIWHGTEHLPAVPATTPLPELIEQLRLAIEASDDLDDEMLAKLAEVAVLLA